MPSTLPVYPLPILGDPPLNNRFLVVFFQTLPDALKTPGLFGKAPNPLDILFRSVRGIGSSVEMNPIEEGGQHLYTQQTPTRITHDNLVLERGIAVPSLLTIDFEFAMSQFRIKPFNVLVALLNADGLPVGAWLFLNALPVRWHLSDFNADEESVVIESMELSYHHRLTLSSVIPA